MDPARLPRWLAGFRERHGDLTVRATAAGAAGAGAGAEAAGPGAGAGAGGVTGAGAGAAWTLVLTGADGVVAELHPPPGAAGATDLAGFVADAQAPRRLGLLLARQAAVAVGVAEGEELVVRKVDAWYVQGRTAAGGQSQQRFARRRGNQAAAAAGKAADLVAQLLLPAAGAGPPGRGGAGPAPESGLAALVTGGDRRTVATILADRRLAPLRERRAERHLPVPTPRLAVLQAAVPAARAVHIRLAQEPPVERG